MDINLVV